MKSPSMNNFSLWKIYNNNKTNSENTMILQVRYLVIIISW